MTEIETRILTMADAHELAPLVTACVQERKRGAPGRPDQFYAERLLNDRTAEIIGARHDGHLAGFALFFDLPDPMTGRRMGQLNEVFVIQAAREKGIEHGLIKAVIAEAAKRDWCDLHWVTPDKPAVAASLAEHFGRPADWSVFTVPIPHR
ncbi:GNAT family N-acetyltransferase [Bauldia sp.]|uniref:GNAT family N-acetyltransferase n=1 Tax=Bauldia sp. TaxID=2575872 RepID=UPI003BAA641F